MSTILVTGPSRSGKSEWAEQLTEQLAQRKQQQVVYVATAQRNPQDAEWQARIETHVARRPAHWHAEEVPIMLTEAIAAHNQHHCLLIDSLGTWLANLIEQSDEAWTQHESKLIETIRQTEATVILVAEETGWGVVPAYKMGRTFRDRLGSLSRKVGAIASETYLVTCGYALPLSKLAEPVRGLSTGLSVANPQHLSERMTARDQHEQHP